MGCSESKLHPAADYQQRLRVNTQFSCATSADTDSDIIAPLVIRAVLLGDASVGKSSLSVRYFNDVFPETYDITFGGVFFKKEVKISKDLSVSLQAWDTGGEERYRSMTPLYYRNASVAFLVCSITDDNPTSSLDYWFRELSEKVSKENMTILVLANKTDLDGKDEAHTIKEWCNRNRLQLFECSAKTGKGVQEAFKRAVNLHLNKLGKTCN